MTDDITTYTGAGSGTSEADGEQARWRRLPEPDPDCPVMIEVFCGKCHQTVGYVGLPPVEGAAVMSAEFTCMDCGWRTWWWSA